MSQDKENSQFLARLYRSLGPLAAAFVLDAADFATFGPLGVMAGWLVGSIIGLWIASIYRLKLPSAILLAILSAVYCTMPLTEFIPAAMIVTAMARFFERPASTELDPEMEGTSRPRKKVDSRTIEKDSPDN